MKFLLKKFFYLESLLNKNLIFFVFSNFVPDKNWVKLVETKISFEKRQANNTAYPEQLLIIETSSDY